MRSKHGFTLVEILFVVLIAAGVIAFSMPAYKRMQERSAYNAATGTLLDVGNAVGSLQRDLKVSTGQFIRIPANGKAVQASSTGSQPSSWSESKSWNQNVVAQSGDNLTNAFMWALYHFNYLKPIKDATGYQFYIVNNAGASAACNGLCKASDSSKNGEVIACMCKSGTKNGCYFGAVFLAGGKIERVIDSTLQDKCTN
ncbi:MAG: type II secretion system protein [Elusimicrobiaceae bacterium]|nr:type II secretion system protein [Elusimicrobiaceae bacterium]